MGAAAGRGADVADPATGGLPPEHREVLEQLASGPWADVGRWRGKISDEPAMSHQSTDCWRPGTLAHFRVALLRHLEAKGAHTLPELEASPPEVLHLPLEAEELTVTLDSARRHGLVARLDPDSGFGPPRPADEWIVTESGRHLARRGLPWLLPHVGRVAGAALTGIAALLTILGTRLSVEGGFWSIAWLVAIGLAGVALVGGAAAWLRGRRSGVGATKRAVAEDWARWAYVFSDLYPLATKSFPWKPMTVAAVVIAIGGLGPNWVDGAAAAEVAFVVAALGGWLYFLLTVGNWLTRWSDIWMEIDKRRLVTLLGGDREPQPVSE